ncbi:DUF2752 domain-containing protein [Senegalimassilia anaerobia]|uniref:DUF2752 domain-containing protein n=2 Tax=Senegalimassilia anaerobia TaxID=1473216 RepID=UPI00349EC097
MRAMVRVLKNPDFMRARLVVYAVVAAYTLLMLFFDPFEYSCSPENPCPGCGFRTGFWLVLKGKISEGLQANFFVGPFLAFAALSVFDVGLCFFVFVRSHSAGVSSK